MKNEFEKALSDQLEYNRFKNLLYKDQKEVLSVNRSFIKFLNEIVLDAVDHQKEIELNELIDFVANEFLAEIHRINQFIYVPVEKIEELKKIYAETWDLIKSGTDTELAIYQKHYPSLARWLSELYPEMFRDELKHRKIISSVTCEEYSPEFQLNIMGIEIADLKSPVLDIGCGSKANLVNHLKTLGVDIIGFDRNISDPNDYRIKSDWFNFEYGLNRWGTIISNAAFSNHSIYSGIFDEELFLKYVFTYNKILESLKPGGAFIYAPQCNGIEQNIDTVRFSITYGKITGDYNVVRIKKLI